MDVLCYPQRTSAAAWNFQKWVIEHPARKSREVLDEIEEALRDRFLAVASFVRLNRSLREYGGVHERDECKLYVEQQVIMVPELSKDEYSRRK